MTVQFISFTKRGAALARHLADALGGEACRCAGAEDLRQWTRRNFVPGGALVFVGAAGIAVRAIAPHIKSKTSDPAVVVVDEGGHFAIPILSGHLGGANDLARQIGAICGAVPAVTTATDVSGVFSVDQWARRQGCAVINPEGIKAVSSRLLRGERISWFSQWDISGPPPAGIALVPSARQSQVSVTLSGEEGTLLRLVPRIGVLGVGCKRGTSAQTLEHAVQALLQSGGICPQAVVRVCSITQKRDEPGLQEFCRARNLPLSFFSPEELAQAEGHFSASDFVQRTVGVDNVCERSAVLGSGGGALWLSKRTGEGTALALALAPFSPDWRWLNE